MCWKIRPQVAAYCGEFLPLSAYAPEIRLPPPGLGRAFSPIRRRRGPENGAQFDRGGGGPPGYQGSLHARGVWRKARWIFFSVAHFWKTFGWVGAIRKIMFSRISGGPRSVLGTRATTPPNWIFNVTGSNGNRLSGHKPKKSQNFRLFLLIECRKN